MIQQISRPTGCAAVLDPISLNRAARISCRGLDPGEALFTFSLGFVFSLATGIVWWLYDLVSTFLFTQGVSSTAKPIGVMLGEKAGGWVGLEEMSLGSFMGGLVVVVITLAPSIMEMIAPRVMHPAAQLGLNVTILFDFITDWPTAAGMIAGHEVPLGWLGRVIATFLLTLVLSLGVQVLFVFALTVTIASAITLIKGPKAADSQAIIIQG